MRTEIAWLRVGKRRELLRKRWTPGLLQQHSRTWIVCCDTNSIFTNSEATHFVRSSKVGHGGSETLDCLTTEIRITIYTRVTAKELHNMKRMFVLNWTQCCYNSCTTSTLHYHLKFPASCTHFCNLEDKDSTLFLNKSRRTAAKNIENSQLQSIGVLGFDRSTSTLVQLHKKESYRVGSKRRRGHSVDPRRPIHRPG